MFNAGLLGASVEKIKDKEISELQELFGNLLQLKSEDGGGKRERLFFPVRVFWMFLSQILSGNISCHETLQKLLSWLCLKTQEIASPNTSAYCKARQRLPKQWLESISEHLASRIENQLGKDRLWYGRSVKVVDGSGLSMPDTEANQNVFPQPKGQKKGCGFPIMRIVVLFSLATGAILRLAHSSLSVHERTLFHQLWQWLTPGDIILADRGFTSFADFFLLLQKGVDSVMRNHARRTKGLRLVKKLGQRDKLVAWKRSRICPKWLEKNVWNNMPEEMLVRQIHLNIDVPGFRTKNIVIVTTLLDSQTYCAEAFTDLYRQRWLAELFLRDIKISMGMDVLKCKTPQMVLKELQMYIIAYNLIRALILQACLLHSIHITRISFKRTADALRQWSPVFLAAREDSLTTSRLLSTFLHYIAQLKVPDRPHRTEPRAIKRRKKNYQLLNKPRKEFEECMHRNHYSNSLS